MNGSVEAIVARAGITQPPSDNRRILILVGGGGTAGIFSAGALHALSELKLSNAFDIALGVSSGAVNLGFFLGRKTDVLKKLYTEKFANAISLIRFWNPYDLQSIRETIYDNLPVREINKSRTCFNVGATSVKDGRAVLLNAKSEVAAIIASSSPPLSSGSSITIGGNDYFDGEIASPLIFDGLMNMAPTHVLAILNRPNNNVESGISTFRFNLMSFYLSYITPALAHKFTNWKNIYGHELALLNNLSKKIPTTIISPEKSLSEFCNNPDTLEEVYWSGFNSTNKIFSR